MSINIIKDIDEAIIHAEQIAKDMELCNKECADDHRQLAEWLKELKERREADKWRPISEPPKEHDFYLVTCEYGVARATDIALFYPDREGEEQWSLNYVTAWKPLPEPYESEDQ